MTVSRLELPQPDTRESGARRRLSPNGLEDSPFVAPDRNEYRFHVRAWSAEQAEAHFRASLRENGVREPGTLLIRNRKGVEVLRSGYVVDPH